MATIRLESVGWRGLQALGHCGGTEPQSGDGQAAAAEAEAAPVTIDLTTDDDNPKTNAEPESDPKRRRTRHSGCGCTKTSSPNRQRSIAGAVLVCDVVVNIHSATCSKGVRVCVPILKKGMQHVATFNEERYELYYQMFSGLVDGRDEYDEATDVELTRASLLIDVRAGGVTRARGHLVRTE